MQSKIELMLSTKVKNIIIGNGKHGGVKMTSRFKIYYQFKSIDPMKWNYICENLAVGVRIF